MADSLYIVNLVTKKKYRVGYLGSLGVTITGMAYDRVRDVMYAISDYYDTGINDGNTEGMCSLYTVNRVTGEATRVGQFYGPGEDMFELCDIACDRYGRLWGTGVEAAEGLAVDKHGVYSIDKTTGRATFEIPMDGEHGGACGFGRDGKLYVVFSTHGYLYRVDVDDKIVEKLNYVSGDGSADNGAGAFEPHTNRFILEDDEALYQINLATATMRKIADASADHLTPPIGTGSEKGGIVFAPGEEPPPIRYVDFDDGDDNNNGWSPNFPWKTLLGPDEDYHGRDIGPGYTYKLRGVVTGFQHNLQPNDEVGTADHPIVLEAWEDNNPPVLEGSDFIIQLQSPAHFVIRNIIFSSGAEMNAGASNILIKNCFFDGNILSGGFSPHPAVLYIVMANDVTVDSCVFYSRNSSQLFVSDGQRHIIQNNVFYGLGTRDEGDIPDSAADFYCYDIDDSGPEIAATIINNTFVHYGRTIPFGGPGFGFTLSGMEPGGPGFVIQNNIFSDIYGVGFDVSNEVEATIGYNLIFDVTDGYYEEGLNSIVNDLGHNVEADPLIINPAGGDFRLYNASPAIDAGNPSVAPEYDFSNAQRDETPDIGALEGGWGDPPTNDDMINAEVLDAE